MADELESWAPSISFAPSAYSKVFQAWGYEVIDLRPVRYLLGKWPNVDKIANVAPFPFIGLEKALVKIGLTENLANVKMLFAWRRRN